MGRKQVKMVSILLCLVGLFVCVHVTDGQGIPTLSPIEKQAVLVFHSLFKASPDLASNFEALLRASNQSDQVVQQLTQGVTENPLTDSFIKAFVQGLGQLQSANLTKVGNQSAQHLDVNGTTMATPVPALQNYLQSLQNQIFSTFTQGLLQQVMQAAAKNPNILKDGQIDPNALLSSVDPVMLLQTTIAQLGSVALLLPSNTSLVTQQCYEDIVDTIDSAVARKGWAIEMIDALGKPNSGLERGSLYFTGAYDECYMVKPRIEKGESVGLRNASKSKSFGTRFCRASFNIDSFVNGLGVDTRGFKMKLIWGMCVPASCHKEDMQNLFKLGVLEQANAQVDDVFCDEDKKLSDDGGAVAAIVILGVFAFFVTIGTLYDASKAARTNKHVEDKSTPSIEENKPSITEVKNPVANGKQYENLAFTPPPGYMPHREHDKEYPDPASNGTQVVVQTQKEQHPNGIHDPEIQKKQHGNDIQDPEIQRVTPPQSKPEAPLIDRLILSFSAYTNVPKLLNAKSNKGSIGCINGIRFLSLTWVILGHTYNYGIINIQETVTASNLLDFEAVLQRFTFQTVVGGGYAVDTFFVLSAFLMTWLQLKATEKRRNKCAVGDWVMFYFHRFWRLTPIYMIVMMTFVCLYRYFISGPFAPSVIQTAENCKSVWWTNLLYINNLAEVDRQCLGWSWYLANDMQFYVVSPIFLVLMYFQPMFGAISTVLLMCLGIAMAFWKEHTVNGNFFSMLSDGGEWWQNVYTVPWCRVHCWAIGMILGLIVYKRERKPLSSKFLNAIGWLLAFGVALFLVYIPYTENKKDGTQWTRTERAFYESFGRAAWGTCIAWVIFACYTGKGGIINSILSWNGFIPLSRLTYATYLVHPMCMMVYSFNRRNLLFVDDYNMIYLFLGHLAISHMVAFVCSIAFEAPFMNLEKVLFRTGRKKQK